MKSSAYRNHSRGSQGASIDQNELLHRGSLPRVDDALDPSTVCANDSRCYVARDVRQLMELLNQQLLHALVGGPGGSAGEFERLGGSGSPLAWHRDPAEKSLGFQRGVPDVKAGFGLHAGDVFPETKHSAARHFPGLQTAKTA